MASVSWCEAEEFDRLLDETSEARLAYFRNKPNPDSALQALDLGERSRSDG